MRIAREPRRLSVEVRFDQSPIKGRVYAEEDEFVRPFSGWLGLMAAIEAARGPALQAKDDESQHDAAR